MDIYKFAAQKGLRFPSARGDLLVEQLFQLPLKHSSGFDLNSVAQTVNSALKAFGEESFVDDASTDPKKKQLEVSLEIVKDVIKTKQEEAAAVQKRKENNERRQKILDAIEQKQDKALSEASIEDLRRELAAIDG